MYAGLLKTPQGVKNIPDLVPIGRRVLVDNPLGLAEDEKVESAYLAITPIASTLIIETDRKVYVEVFAPNPTQMLLLAKEGELTPPLKTYKVKPETLPTLIDYIKGLKEGYVLPVDDLSDYLVDVGVSEQTIFALGVNARFASAKAWENLERFYLLERGFFRIKKAAEHQNGFISFTEDGLVKGEIAQTLTFRLSNGTDAKLMSFVVPKTENLYSLLKEKVADSWAKKSEIIAHSIRPFALDLEVKYKLSDKVALIPEESGKIEKTFKGFRRVVKIKLPLPNEPKNVLDEIALVNFLLDAGDADSPLMISLPKLEALAKQQKITSLIYHNPSPALYYLKIFYHIDFIIAFLNAVSQFLYEALGEEAYYPSYSKLADEATKEAEKFENIRLKLIKALSDELGVKSEYLEKIFNVVAFSNLTSSALRALEDKILGAAEEGGSAVNSVVKRIKNTYSGLVNVAFSPLYRCMGLKAEPAQELDKLEERFEQGLEALYNAVEAATSPNNEKKELAQFLADFYLQEKGDKELAQVLAKNLGITQAYFTLIDYPGLRETIAAITNIEREVGKGEVKQAIEKIVKGRYPSIAFLMSSAPRAKRLFKKPDEGETYSLSQYLFNIAYKGVKNKLSASGSQVSRRESLVKEKKEEETKPPKLVQETEVQQIEEESGIEREELKHLLELAQIPIEEETYTNLDELTEATLENIYHSTEEVTPERRHRFTRGATSLHHLEKFYRAEGIAIGGGREARFQPILDIFTALEALKRAIEETTWEEFQKAPHELDYNEITSALFDKVIQKLESKGVSLEVKDFFESFVYNIILETLTYVSTFLYRVGVVREEKLSLKERAALFHSFIELLFAFLEDIKQWISIVVVNPAKLNSLFEIREEFSNLKPFTPRWLSVLKKLTQRQIKVKKDFLDVLGFINGRGKISLKTRVLNNLVKAFEQEGVNISFTARIPHLNALVIELLTIFGYLADNGKLNEFRTEENFVKLAKAWAVMIVNSALGLDKKKGKKADIVEKTEQGYKVPNIAPDILTGKKLERRLFALLREIGDGASINRVLAEFRNIWEQIEALSTLLENKNLFIRTVVEEQGQKREVVIPYLLAFVPPKEYKEKGISALPGVKTLDPGILAAKKLISDEFAHLAEFYKAYFKAGSILLSTQIPTQELLVKHPELRDFFEEFLKREIAAAVQRSLLTLARYYMINNALESAGRPTALLILKRIFFTEEKKAIDVFFDFLKATGITANTYFAKNSVIAARLPVRLKLLDSGKAANLGLPITKSYLLAQWESVAESMPYYNVPIYGIPSWAFMMAPIIIRPFDLINEKTVKGQGKVEKLITTLALTGVPREIIEKAKHTKGWDVFVKSIRKASNSSAVAYFATKTVVDILSAAENIENKLVSSFVRTYDTTITEVQGRYAFSLVEDIPTLALQVPQILNKAGIDIYLNNLLQSVRSYLILESLMAAYYLPEERQKLESQGKSFRAYISTLLKEAFVGKGLKDLSVPEIVGKIHDAYRELLFNEQPKGESIELNADEVISAFEDFRDIIQKTSYFNALLVMSMIDMLAYLGEAPKTPAEAFAKLSAASSYITVLNAAQTAYKYLKGVNGAWAAITDDPVYGLFALIDTYKKVLVEYRKQVLSPKAISSPQNLAGAFQSFRHEHLKPLVLRFVSNKFLKGLSILKLLTHTIAFEPTIIERVFPRESYPYSAIENKNNYEKAIISFLTTYATDYMANFLYVFKGRIGTQAGEEILERLAKAGEKTFSSSKGTFGFYAKIGKELELKSLTPDVQKQRNALLYTMAALNTAIVNPLNEALESLGGGGHATLMGQIVSSVYKEVKATVPDALDKEKLDTFYKQTLPEILRRTFNKVVQKIGASGLFIVDIFKAIESDIEEFINWVRVSVTPLTAIYADKIPGDRLAEAVSAGVGNLLSNKVKIANLSLKALALRSMTAYYASAVKALYDERLNKDEIALLQLLVAFLFLHNEPEYFMALEQQFRGTFVEEAFNRVKNRGAEQSPFILAPQVLSYALSSVLNGEVEGIGREKLSNLILLFIAFFVEANYIPAYVSTKLNAELLKWFPEFMNAGILASPIAFFVGRRTIQRFGLYLGKTPEEAKEAIVKAYEEKDLERIEEAFKKIGEVRLSPEELMNYAIIAPHRI